MKITALKETKAGRISLFLDGQFITSLDTLTFGEYGLCVDDEIDEDTLNEILRLSQSRRTKQKAVELLSYRPHSKAELKKKLMKNASEEDAENAISRMEELEMVNDLSFAKLIVREYGEIKLYGIHRVTQELYRRGVEPEIIAEALNELPDQQEIITRFLNSRWRAELRGNLASRERLVRKLITRGFDYDDIRPVASRFEIEDKSF